jgi:RNA polymerase sigma factor (sigma-70 family)
LLELLRQAQAGSCEAAQQLFDHYRPSFLAIVRRMLKEQHRSRLRTILDSDDFLQDAQVQLAAGRLRNAVFEEPAEFAAYVAAIVRNEVRRKARHYPKQARNNLQRESHVEDLAAVPQGPARNATTPDQIFGPDWNLILDEQPPVSRRVLTGWQMGYTIAEIAAHLGIGVTNVRLIIDQFANRYGITVR